jgi:hypothetical protein
VKHVKLRLTDIMKVKTGNIAVVVLALTPIFCQAQVSEDQKVLDSFKSLVNRHVDSYKNGGREHVTKLSGGWAKERFVLDIASVKFDVEKTSSLVSPFIGTLTFRLTRSVSAFYPTEADAAADLAVVGSYVDQYLHKHVFAYQDHQWQPTSRKHMITSKSLLNGEYFSCDEFLLKDDIKPSHKDINGCLEEFDANKK